MNARDLLAEGIRREREFLFPSSTIRLSNVTDVFIWMQGAIRRSACSCFCDELVCIEELPHASPRIYGSQRCPACGRHCEFDLRLEPVLSEAVAAIQSGQLLHIRGV